MIQNLEKLFENYIKCPKLESQQKIEDFYLTVKDEDRFSAEEEIKKFLRSDFPASRTSWENFFTKNINYETCTKSFIKIKILLYIRLIFM